MFYFADRKLKEAVPVGNEFPLPKLLGCYRHVVSSNCKFSRPSAYVVSFR